jgi:hypothetical protein
MMYYGATILVAIVAMLVVSLKLLKRSILFGILFSGFFFILLMFHGRNFVSALSLSRPTAPTTVANQNVPR